VGAGGGGGSSFGPKGTAFTPSASARSGVTIAYTPPAPAVVVTRPRAGQVVRRFSARGRVRQLVIAGRATSPSGVRRVAITIERLPRMTTGAAAMRCMWLRPTTGLRRQACDRPPALTATLRRGGSWTYRVSKNVMLPAGRYRVTAIAEDKTGVLGNAAPRAARGVTFQLSRR